MGRGRLFAAVLGFILIVPAGHRAWPIAGAVAAAGAGSRTDAGAEEPRTVDDTASSRRKKSSPASGPTSRRSCGSRATSSAPSSPKPTPSSSPPSPPTSGPTSGRRPRPSTIRKNRRPGTKAPRSKPIASSGCAASRPPPGSCPAAASGFAARRSRTRSRLYRCIVPFSLTFYDCLLDSGINIRNAKVQELDITNCCSAKIDGPRRQVAENVYLRKCSSSAA